MTGVATALAAVAGLLAGPALLFAAEAITARASRAAPLAGVAGWLERVLLPIRRAGGEGVAPSDRERARLQLAAGGAGLAAGLVVGGLRMALVLGVASAWLAARSLVWRRDRYSRNVEQGASTAALALADALAAGHSVRGAITAAASGVDGAMGQELRRAARELDVGAGTDVVLRDLRRRARSRRVDLVVAAIQLQRRSGGSLAALLREIGATLDEQERVEGEARGASAQARFTSLLVLLLPVGGLLLAELASPGLVGRIATSTLGLWLLGAALALQVTGIALIARISRIEAGGP